LITCTFLKVVQEATKANETIKKIIFFMLGLLFARMTKATCASDGSI
jgi:hypothetical protein